MPNLSTSAASILGSFENQKIMVVGDVMLDRYTWGRANRISPEAPVPILDFDFEENRLGGAANVTLNLMSLGAKALLFGVVGSDQDGDVLISSLEANGIPANGILTSPERVTTVKTRIMAGRQQLVRLDKEQTNDLSEKEESSFLANALATLESGLVNGLLLQDYNKGVLTPMVIKGLMTRAKALGIPVFVDPKLNNFWSFQGASLFKPNLKEVKEAMGLQIALDIDSLKSIANTIRQKIGCKILLITLSDQGLFLDDGNFSAIVGTKARLVADPCGAGDTVISIASLAVCTGLSAENIALLANLAGGQVVEKSGVVAIDKVQLRAEFEKYM